MNSAILFFRTRRWLVVIAISAVTAVLIVLCGPLNYTLNPRSGYLVGVTAQLPVIPAIAIQATLDSPRLASQETASARKLLWWRYAHIILLTALAAVAVGLAAIPLMTPTLHDVQVTDQGPVAIVRNLFGLTGAALAGATIVGARFAWTIPFAWLILPFLFFPGPDSDPAGIMTLVVQPDSAFTPFIFAITLWAVGTALRGSRKTLPEAVGYTER